MRLFVGTLLRASNQVLVDGFVSDLVAAHPDSLRSIPPSSAHLTYAFCEHADAAATADIVRAVTQAAEAHAPFAITLGQPHVVGAGSRPRLVCAGLVSELEVQRLTADLFGRLQRVCRGLPMSVSRTPHVTLARFKRRTARLDSEAVSAWLLKGGLGIGVTDRIEDLQVIQSTISASGPTYEILEQRALTASADLLHGGTRHR